MTDTEHSARGRIWFTGGWVLLFLMAILWSVDTSIVNICLGAAVFCFFQFARLSLGKSRPVRTDGRAKGYSETAPAQAVEELLEEIQQGFGKSSSKISGRNVFRMVAGFAVFSFILFIVVAVLTGPDSDHYVNLEKAYEHNSNGNYDSAAYYFRLASLSDPDNPLLYYERGNAFLSMERYDSAIVLYDRSLEIDPYNNQVLYNKGYALFTLGRYRQAMDEARRITGNDPNDLQARLLLGDCYYNQQQVDSALHWYSSAYDDGYRSAPLSHMMAYIYDTRGQTARAIELYKEALEYDDSIEEIYSRLSELLPPEEAASYRERAGKSENERGEW